jgi:hypothetical protein
LLLSLLALAGASVRYVLAPRAAAPGDVQLVAACVTRRAPQPGSPMPPLPGTALRWTARA